MSISGFARSTAKALAATALHYSGIHRLIARASRIAVGGRRVLIVSYHRVVEDFEAEARQAIPGLLLSRDTFLHHLDELHRNGFDVVPLGTALEVIAGRLQTPRDVAVVTFDDGYRDVYEHAFPVLRRRGLPATVYLASGFVSTGARFPHDRLYHLVKLSLAGRGQGGRNVLAGADTAVRAAAVVDELISKRSAGALLQLIAGMEQSLGGGSALLPPTGEVLNWDMVREMAAAGLEFGAHTVHHVVLPHESEETIELEVGGSMREIEKETGRPVLDFAYPNGYYDRRVVSVLVRHGFRSGVTTEDLPNRVGGDPFRLRRKTLWENYSRGPFGYSSSLTQCHLDDVFTMLALTRPVSGEHQPSDEAAKAVAPEPSLPSPGARA